MDDYSDGPIWRAFGLTYARYAVYRRRALQSMPADWQQRFLDLIREMEEALPEDALYGDFTVQLRDKGRFVSDHLAEYRHARPFETLQQAKRVADMFRSGNYNVAPKTTEPQPRPGSEGQGET